MKTKNLFETIPDGVENFARSYHKLMMSVLSEADFSDLERFVEVINKCHDEDKLLYSFGNGGSAAIANHLLCDHSKGISSCTALRPRIVSLASSPEIITALLNDVGADHIFLGQLENLLRPGDVCFAVSSSGNSPNIVKAVEYAKLSGCTVLALTGFDGGKLRSLADYSLHVPIKNYGIVEDAHQSIMHILAQYIRATSMENIGETIF